MLAKAARTGKYCVLPAFTGSGAPATSLGSRDPGRASISFLILSHHFWHDFVLLSSPVRETDRKLKITRQFERIKDKGEQHNYVIVAIGQESRPKEM